MSRSDGAERVIVTLYTREGWTRSGIIPDYALFPDGRLCDTAIMWKRLDR